MEIPSEFSYVSAPTSPSVCSLEESMNFYSCPTSPSSDFPNALFGLSQTEPTTPRSSYEDHTSYSNLEDFEFDTSCHFNPYSDLESGQESDFPTDHEKRQQNHGWYMADLLPAMSFADELFCNGKVVPLAPPQLKLPPRLCAINHKVGGSSGTAETSPRSPHSVLKLSFSRQSLWNDDFDPFMVALEHVKEEKRGKIQGKNRRRARSLSPLRVRSSKSLGLVEPKMPMQETKSFGSNGLCQPNGSVSARWPSPQEALKQEEGPTQEMGFESNALASSKQERKSPRGLAEPRGITIARRVRNAKIDPGKPNEPNMTTVQKPAAETGKTPRGGGGSCRRERKRQKIWRFIFRGASSKKESGEESKVEKIQNAALSKPNFLRRLSFKRQYNGDNKKVVSQVAKMTLMQYRPRLSLCLGYGAKYVE